MSYGLTGCGLALAETSAPTNFPLAVAFNSPLHIYQPKTNV